ncbi:hypothetical protein HUK80_07655 [Flavobacterium sp. MAH-1]|uniref:Uncharacterized protein n=1 Tax=Flavobacterium agri TaxID=2743471 RepID=A0A7Y9C501_9FLAO|nr:hypothetical protein [Flavobacterium agri]NUY80762.1 hypothetical protein [Flavobacterium agri]NYA70786.1 hypothetical protein [Flavobacterium agri]
MENFERIQKIKKIGSQEAYLAVGIALAIDLCVITWWYLDNDYQWLIDHGYVWKFPLAAIFMIFLGQFFGKKFALGIIGKSWNWIFQGPICAMITLAATCLLTGLTAFPIDFMRGFTEADDLLFYTLGVTLLVILYSFIPVGIHGVWFGYRIYKKGLKTGLYEEDEKP